MGIVEEVGSEPRPQPGDRVVVPFNISCGHCWMCSRGLFAQCETTQNREFGKGASLFGYTTCTARSGRPGGVPARPAGRVRPGAGCPRSTRRALPLPLRHPADGLAGLRVRRCARGRHPRGVRPRAGRPARPPHRADRGRRVIGVDRVPERLALRAAGARRWSTWTPSTTSPGDPRLTDGRGADGPSTPSAWRHMARRSRRQRSAPWAAPRRSRQAADRQVAIDRRRRCSDHQVRTTRRHSLGLRRLRRRGRPDAADGDVRPRHHHAAGSVPRPPLDRGHLKLLEQTTTCSASRLSRPIARHSKTRRRPTRCSRRSRTAASRWC